MTGAETVVCQGFLAQIVFCPKWQVCPGLHFLQSMGNKVSIDCYNTHSSLFHTRNTYYILSLFVIRKTIY